jgi:hypothetical protein
VTKQRIKLMTDYGAFPLWGMDRENVGSINPGALPLSDDTIADLMRWQAKWDAVYNAEDPAESGFVSKQEAAAFEQEGIRLWMQVRHELEPNYDVAYHSIYHHRTLDHPDELTRKLI